MSKGQTTQNPDDHMKSSEFYFKYSSRARQKNLEQVSNMIQLTYILGAYAIFQEKDKNALLKQREKEEAKRLKLAKIWL